MAQVLPSYLRGEIARMLFAIALLLVLVVFSGLLTDVLNKISRGQFPPGLLLSQIVLRIPMALTLLLPLAGFLAVMLAYARLYRDAEMAVLRASGFSEARLLRPALVVGIVLAVALGLNAMLLAPEARRVANEMIEQANQKVLIAGLEPGRFVEVGNSGAVVYVGKLDGWNLSDVLLLKRNEDGSESIVRGRAGQVEQRAQGRISVLHLTDGERVDLGAANASVQRASFVDAEVLLPDRLKPARNDPAALEQQGYEDLLASRELPARAEWQSRLSAPIQLLLLVLLAIPLARAAPRQARYDRILIGFLLYVVYSMLLFVGRGLMALGKTPDWLGLWWIHGLFAVVVLLLWWPLLRSHFAGRRLIRQVA